MGNFYLTAEALPATQRLVLRRMLSMGVVLVGGGFCYGYFLQQTGLYASLGLSLVFLGVVAFSYRRTMAQQRAALASYRLEVAPTHLTRFQQGLPPLQLQPHEITSITQNYQGLLTIATADRYRVVYVPPQVTGRAQLLHELAWFAPLIIQPSQTLFERFAPFISIAFVIVMASFYLTDNKLVTAVSGRLTLGILGWSSWHMWRNPNQTAQTQRLRWILPLVFLAILGSMAARLLQ